MAGRITLLILMTGLFAAVWSSDHPPRKSVETTVPDQDYHSESVRETTMHRWPVSRYERVVDASDNWVPIIAETSVVELPSRHEPRSLDTSFLPLIGQLLAGKWLDAGLMLQTQRGDSLEQRAVPLSEQITSQPGSSRSTQR